MTIKHIVQCGPCGKEVEAIFPNAYAEAPRGWLSLDYRLVDLVGMITIRLVDLAGMITISEARHACPDCAPKVVEQLNKLA